MRQEAAGDRTSQPLVEETHNDCPPNGTVSITDRLALRTAVHSLSCKSSWVQAAGFVLCRQVLVCTLVGGSGQNNGISACNWSCLAVW